MIKNKFLIFILALFLALTPMFSRAQESANASAAAVVADESFTARVIKILDQREVTQSDGSIIVQQNVLLLGLNGEYQGRQVEYRGITDVQVATVPIYRVGDKVVVQRSVASEGEENFYIVDFVRQGYLYVLVFVFALSVVVVGGFKGLRSLLALAVSFFIIIGLMLPRILAGNNPLPVAIVGSFLILTMIIYLTEGWNRKSHLAAVSVIFSLGATLGLSVLFTAWTHLTGLSEEAVFLMGIGGQAIDFRGLLLAGMLIGALGVLDDVIIGQVEAVKQIKEANPELAAGQVYRRAYRVGNTHLGAIVNTLFLTYAGASLPLLLLFNIKQEPFLSFSQVINNEIIATEIVRTLVGSIGLALALPITTYLAAYWLKIKNNH